MNSRNDFDEILRTVPINRSRSRLEPYRSLVEELHRRAIPLREIASLLEQRCNVKTSHVAIHKLLQHKYTRVADPRRQPIRVQVAADKSINDGVTGTAAGDFHFEPNEPLKLSPKNTR